MKNKLDSGWIELNKKTKKRVKKKKHIKRIEKGEMN